MPSWNVVQASVQNRLRHVAAGGERQQRDARWNEEEHCDEVAEQHENFRDQKVDGEKREQYQQVSNGTQDKYQVAE